MNDNVKRGRGRPALSPEEKEAIRKERFERSKSQAVSVHNPNKINLPGVPDTIEDGFTARAIALNLEMTKRPKCDLNNPDEVRERLAEYFEIFQRYDMKPTIAGLALMLGVNRRRIYEINLGIDRYGKPTKINPESVYAIQQVYGILENIMESYSINGKVNPVTSIFMLKNHYGYRDQQEYVVTPNTEQQDSFNAEDIKSRYLTDDSIDGELTD